MDEATQKIRGGLDTIREIVTKAEEYAQRLRGTLLSEQAAQEVIRRTQQYKQALTRTDNRLDQMKRRVNEWIREQLDRVLGGKHNFETNGSINTSVGKSGQNVRVQKEATPPEIHLLAPLKRLDELAHQGPGAHGPQRHEGQLTEQQLEDRCTRGIDPMTGTTTDGVHGNTHHYGRHATKVNTPEDYVKAHDYLKNSDEFVAKKQAAEAAGESQLVVERTKLEDIYGPDYKSKVTGRTRIGSKANPQGVNNTDFTDGTMFAVFKKDAQGEWYLYTMYPEPKL